MKTKARWLDKETLMTVEIGANMDNQDDLENNGDHGEWVEEEIFDDSDHQQHQGLLPLDTSNNIFNRTQRVTFGMWRVENTNIDSLGNSQLCQSPDNYQEVTLLGVTQNKELVKLEALKLRWETVKPDWSLASTCDLWFNFQHQETVRAVDNTESF